MAHVEDVLCGGMNELVMILFKYCKRYVLAYIFMVSQKKRFLLMVFK